MTQQGDILDIRIRDFSGRLIEKFKCQIRNKEVVGKIMNLLSKKYNINGNYYNEEEAMKKDWLNPDADFL